MRTRISTQVRRAFTLIEILIVVVILGILAAIVIPQFTDASQDAMETSLHSQLQTIRSQIELHDVQNPATVFDATTGWDPLVQNDYLQTEPRNPLSGNPGLGAALVATNGWQWTTNAAGDAWTTSVYPLNAGGTAVAYVDSNGDPY